MLGSVTEGAEAAPARGEQNTVDDRSAKTRVSFMMDTGVVRLKRLELEIDYLPQCTYRRNATGVPYIHRTPSY